MTTNNTKECNKCKNILPLDSFEKGRNVCRTCRTCRCQQQKEWREKRGYSEWFKWYQENLSLVKQNLLKCRKCKNIYPLDYFYDNKASSSFGKDTCCKSCLKEYSEQTKERHAETSKIWYAENKEKVNKKQKIYYLNNKEKILAKRKTPEYKEKCRLYCQNNLAYRINKSISSAIYKQLKGMKNSAHWEKFVPYTFEELKIHLEKQFQPGMTWENYGLEGWEIDHIRPRNTFNITSPDCEDFKQCWALSNLRPLWVSENRSRPKDGSDLSI